MRHRKSGRKLSRKTGPRRALIRSIVRNLLLAKPDEKAGHLERIVTTPAKAKEARRLAERVITLGKRGDLAARRRAMHLLGDRQAVTKVFAEIGPRYAQRPGGYTRILHWHKRRLGDNAPQVIFELVEAEVRAKAERKRPAETAPQPSAPATAAPQADAEPPAQPPAPAENEKAE
jgi:large subunit ribosomal protein L17